MDAICTSPDHRRQFFRATNEIVPETIELDEFYRSRIRRSADFCHFVQLQHRTNRCQGLNGRTIWKYMPERGSTLAIQTQDCPSRYSLYFNDLLHLLNC